MANSIPNWLVKRAYLTPERIALRFNGENYTFQQLYDESLQQARKLNSLQIKADDFVGILLTNHPQTVFILFGLQLLGVRTVILNNHLTSDELVYQLQDSNASFLIAASKFNDKVAEVKKQLTHLPIIFTEEVLRLEETPFQEKETFLLNDICTVMYTSGTTGHPKGVKQTYGNHWWSAVGSVLNLGLRENDCWLLAVPLFHISGFSILIRSVVYGITVHLFETFRVEAVNKAIMRGKVTIMSAVSTMLDRLMNNLQERTYPASFRCMLLGGGPAPRPLLEKCQEKQIPVFQTYGMTETASQIVTLTPEHSLTKLGSAGKPLFPAQLRIETENGTIAKPNIAGEIVVRGPSVTSGYLNRPVETEQCLQDGWFYTGDIGYVDEEGFLFVLDRRLDLIISGGENIYPAEIESVLLAHPKVIEVGVIGKEHEEWGQVPIAFVVLKPNEEMDEAALSDFCKQRLAKYKVPKQFISIKELPRNAANKLLRRELHKLL